MKPHRLLTIIFTLALGTSITLHAQDASAPQSWTASDGRVIKAKFIKLDGESVVIEKDGKAFALPLAKLNAESVALAKKMDGVPPLNAPAAASPSAALDPQRFFGKTFAECEVVLGKPASVMQPEGERRSHALIFSNPKPGVSQIKLERVPDGSIGGPVPDTGNFVWYYFPKGTVKTMGECFKLTDAKSEGAYSRVMKSGTSAGEFPDIAEGDPLSDTDIIRIEALPGRFAATWTPAVKSLNRPSEYRHEKEDTLSFQAQIGPTTRERVQQMKEQMIKGGKVLAAPAVVVHDSPELRKNGAFGFPQSSAKVLADQPEARFSAWSNAEWLYVQIVVWADDDDTKVKGGDGTEDCDQSLLLLDLDADQKYTPNVDRKYNVGPLAEKRGLRYQIHLGEGKLTPLIDDSKGRGSVRFVPAAGDQKLRVDSFLITLAELGKKPGDTIRLILSGKSTKPYLAFNSAGRKTNGRAMFYVVMPMNYYHDFTLGEQTGTIDPALVPDGRVK